MQIIEEASDKYEQTTTENISIAPVPETAVNNVQAGLLKNMVPDPGWFDGD